MRISRFAAIAVGFAAGFMFGLIVAWRIEPKKDSLAEMPKAKAIHFAKNGLPPNHQDQKSMKSDGDWFNDCDENLISVNYEQDIDAGLTAAGIIPWDQLRWEFMCKKYRLFPKGKGKAVKLVARLFRAHSKTIAVRIMAARGFRPATLRELLAAAQVGFSEKILTVVAAGSARKMDSDDPELTVPVVYFQRNNNCLDIVSEEYLEDPGTRDSKLRYLGIRKKER